MQKHLTSFFLFFISLSFSQNTQTITTSLDSNIRDVSELDIGFNRRSDQGTWWTDSSFINLVEAMNPDVVRYPGGTQANYWDWSTGQFLENTDKSWNNKEVVTISTFLDALPTRTKVVYVVNMARPTPATGVSVTASEQVLKSDATLNLKIADMLDALATFEAEGKLPYAIELGNEFYFGNEESGIFHILEENGNFYASWNTNTNQPYVASSKADATVFIAKFYLKQCVQIVSSIKAIYPNLKFVLTTTKGGSPARDAWNNTIFDELENNTQYSSFKNDIFAVTQHYYIKNEGLMTPISDYYTSEIAIAEGIEYPINNEAYYDLVPPQYKIWITEYGAVKEIAEETWTSAVRYAAFTYSWISLGEKIEQLDWHYISDNNVVNANASPMKLAPIGIAVKQLQMAAVNMDEMQQIVFNTNPLVVNNVKSLYGLKFKNDTKESLFIINTSDTDFTQIQFDNLITYTGQPIITQYYSNVPYTNGVYDGDNTNTIISATGDLNNTFNAKNFSITLIEVENELLSEGDIKSEAFIVFVDNEQQYVLIKGKIYSTDKLNLYDLQGRIVKRFIFESNDLTHKFSTSFLKQGLYILTLRDQEKYLTKKIIIK